MPRFADLRELLAKANEVKAGDQLAEIAARSEQERVADKCALADVPLSELLARPLIEDDVTQLIHESFDQNVFAPIRSMTVGEIREHILSDFTTEQELSALQPGIIAATADA